LLSKYSIGHENGGTEEDRTTLGIYNWVSEQGNKNPAVKAGKADKLSCLEE
jgi:hypothetical protein